MYKRRLKDSVGGILLMLLLVMHGSPGAEEATPLTVKVGIYQTPPLLSFGPDEAEEPASGLFVDILRDTAERSDWELQFVPGTWEESIARLQSGAIDLLPAIAVNQERERLFRFTRQSIVTNWGQIFVSPNSSIQSITDLDGKRIAALRNDIYIRDPDGLPTLCERFSLDCRFHELPDYASVVAAVERGDADAGLINRFFGATHAGAQSLHATPIMIMPVDVRFAVSEESPLAQQLVDALNTSVALLKEDPDSVYHRSLDNLLEPARVVTRIPPWLRWFLPAAGGVFVLLALGYTLLRWQMSIQTADLRASEQRYRELFESASISIWEEDLSEVFRKLTELHAQGISNLEDHLEANPELLASLAASVRVRDVNPATLKMLEAESKEQLFEGLPQVFTETSLRAFQRGLLAMWEGHSIYSVESEHRTLNGRIIHVLVSHPVPATLEDASRVPVIVHDLTTDREMKTALRRSEARLRTLLDALPDLVWLKDPDGVYIACNHKFERFFGAPESDIIGHTDHDFLPAEQADFFRSNDLAAIEKGEPLTIEEEVEYADDGHREILETIKTPMYAGDRELLGVIGVGRDITERKRQEQRILHQAHYDMLTNLPNRFLTLDRLNRMLHDSARSEQRVAVLFVDLDDFKKINDTLGHETGDHLLIEVASRLQTALRKGDTVGRFGGDEFVILLGGLRHARDAAPVVENLLEDFRAPLEVDGRELVITVSIGVAISPDDGDTPSELLRRADSALYHAKEQGRDSYSFYTNSMNLDVSRRFVVEEQMRGALARGEFRLTFQPQVAIHDGRLVAVEALLRWENPRLGVVSPEEFIPIAEHTSLITPIGQFVMQQACKVLARLQKIHGNQLRMAVNLSPRQFRDNNLPSILVEAIAAAGLLPESIELEITEGTLVSNLPAVDEALKALTQIGVQLAMDDFGTGYSSLSYLRRFPFQVLKIDRSFVHDIEPGAAGNSLIEAIIAMAHSLDLKVVAEGVENTAQLEYLRGLGCDYAQGFLLGHPISLEEIDNAPWASRASQSG